MKQLVLVLSFSLLVAVGCSNMLAQNQASENQGSKVLSEEDSQKIAIDFLRSSPTFRFDGIQKTLTSTV